MASGFGRITLSLPNLSTWITPNTIAFQMNFEILSKFMSRICILLFYKCSDNASRCEIIFLLKNMMGFCNKIFDDMSNTSSTFQMKVGILSKFTSRNCILLLSRCIINMSCREQIVGFGVTAT